MDPRPDDSLFSDDTPTDTGSIRRDEISLFERFLKLMEGRPAKVVSTNAGKVAWGSMSELSTADASKMDKWFIEFESRLQSQQVPRDQWTARFVECPSVPENLKSRVRQNGNNVHVPYEDLRRQLLNEFGPTDAVSFFRRRLHTVRCSSAAEAKETLSELLELHNRAATDALREQLTPKDLCYCFIDSLPKDVSDHLEANFGLASLSDQPLEHLFKMARARERVAFNSSSLLLADASSAFAAPPTPPVESPVEQELLALFRRAIGGMPPQKQARYACYGCGRSCPDRRQCPAQNARCNSCGKIGHFASVCRSARAPSASGNPNFAPQRSPSNPNSAPQQNFREVSLQKPPS
jgi:hypothetical protein